MDRIARDVFGSEIGAAVANGTPRYRGVYSVKGLDDGTINGVKMNLNDWVLYMGASGAWMPDYCYRWTVSGWEQISYNEMDRYMAALNDITDGRDNGKFMAVFCRLLWAQRAMIDRLESELILIKQGGEIRTVGFDGRNGSVPGFWLKGADGSIEANNIKTKGMNATNITVDGILTGNANFVLNNSHYLNISAMNINDFFQMLKQFDLSKIPSNTFVVCLGRVAVGLVLSNNIVVYDVETVFLKITEDSLVLYGKVTYSSNNNTVNLGFNEISIVVPNIVLSGVVSTATVLIL